LLSISLLASTPALGQAVTSPEALGRVREHVRSLAFNPTTYFRRHGDDDSMIRIVYTGDDYAWPVYSIAIAEGCLAEDRPEPGCRSRLTARMVRAPAPPNFTRPRQRGSHLVHQLVQRRAMSRSSIKAQLAPSGVQWLEADLRTCSGASAILARSGQLNWVPDEISNPQLREEIVVHLHADIIEVVFDYLGRRSTYLGYIADHSPAAWAQELSDTLEPCWRPARVPPPWSR
jgi:hypothetical protein